LGGDYQGLKKIRGNSEAITTNYLNYRTLAWVKQEEDTITDEGSY
jgi:hypothetical protein